MVLGLALVLVPALVSYAGAVLGPSNVGVGVRSVEWLRDHGLAWLVSDVERAWYSFHTPATGGAALKALPTVGVGVGLGGDAGVPAPIPPAITPALAGEGRWQRTGPLAGGRPPVLVTTFRPDLAYPRMVAGVAWIDHTRTSISLYPGRYEPASATLRGPLEVPLAARGQLVATFNSGFKLQDAHGGFAALGHADVPLVAGQATLVGYRDGRVDIRAWAGPAVPGSDVLFARQNLPLILAAGQLNPNLSDGPAWGATLGNAVRVWRSGIGINARGDLLYAAANNQTVSSLAGILRRAGAVRAMELDINYEWVAFNAYGAAGAAAPAKLLPGMTRSATRYLSPDDRDFFAVYARG